MFHVFSTLSCLNPILLRLHDLTVKSKTKKRDKKTIQHIKVFKRMIVFPQCTWLGNGSQMAGWDGRDRVTDSHQTDRQDGGLGWAGMG